MHSIDYIEGTATSRALLLPILMNNLESYFTRQTDFKGFEVVERGTTSGNIFISFKHRELGFYLAFGTTSTNANVYISISHVSTHTTSAYLLNNAFYTANFAWYTSSSGQYISNLFITNLYNNEHSYILGFGAGANYTSFFGVCQTRNFEGINQKLYYMQIAASATDAAKRLTLYTVNANGFNLEGSLNNPLNVAGDDATKCVVRYINPTKANGYADFDLLVNDWYALATQYPLNDNTPVLVGDEYYFNAHTSAGKKGVVFKAKED